MQNLKRNDTNELIYKTETDSRLREQTMVTRGEGWGEGIVREFGIDMYTLLYLKWITNKDLLYSTCFQDGALSDWQIDATEFLTTWTPP